MGHAEVQFPFLSFDALGSHTIQMNSAWRTFNLVRAEQVVADCEQGRPLKEPQFTHPMK